MIKLVKDTLPVILNESTTRQGEIFEMLETTFSWEISRISKVKETSYSDNPGIYVT